MELITKRKLSITNPYKYLQIFRLVSPYLGELNKLRDMSKKSNIVTFCIWCLENQAKIEESLGKTKANEFIKACEWILNNPTQVQNIVEKYKDKKFSKIKRSFYRWVIIILKSFDFLEITEEGLCNINLNRYLGFLKAHKKGLFYAFNLKNKFEALQKSLSLIYDYPFNRLREIIEGKYYVEEFKELLKDEVIEIEKGLVYKMFKVLEKFGFVYVEELNTSKAKVYLLDREEFVKLMKNL